MQVFLFSDIHSDETIARRLAAAAQAYRASVVISAGDIAEDGTHLDSVYASFRNVGAPVFAVPGNHDHLDRYGPAIRAAGWKDLHGRVREVDGWFFAGFGLPVIDSHYAGPIEADQSDDPRLTSFLAGLNGIDAGRLILVTHLPPFGTVASRDARFVERGSAQLRRWVDAFRPKAVLCGHVHLKEVAVDQTGKTLVVNAGPHGWTGTFP